MIQVSNRTGYLRPCVIKFWSHIALIMLIFLNGMGYTLIQVHFYLDREQITALHCINKEKPELECGGKCELGKRLSKAKDQNENQAEIALEELSLTFLGQKSGGQYQYIPRLAFETFPTPAHQSSHALDMGWDFFHPPQG